MNARGVRHAVRLADGARNRYAYYAASVYKEESILSAVSKRYMRQPLLPVQCSATLRAARAVSAAVRCSEERGRSDREVVGTQLPYRVLLPMKPYLTRMQISQVCVGVVPYATCMICRTIHCSQPPTPPVPHLAALPACLWSQTTATLPCLSCPCCPLQPALAMMSITPIYLMA
jgi:hypothetical protein